MGDNRISTDITQENEYHFWLAALEGNAPAAIIDFPMSGRWRSKRGGQPVAIWRKWPEGAIKCKIGQHLGDENTACNEWNWCCSSPQSAADYKIKIETGYWPNENPVVAQTNHPPDDNSFEGLRDSIENLEREAKKFLDKGAAQSQNEADQAADVATKLGKLRKQANDARLAETKPLREAKDELDAKWNTIIDLAGIYERIKSVVCDPWLRHLQAEKAKAETEARRVATEAQAEARRLQEAAVEAARQAARSGSDSLAAVLEEQAEAAVFQAQQAAAKVEAVTSQKVSAGSRGRSVSLRKKTIVTISDRAKLLEYFKDRDEITELLLAMAEKAVKAGIAVPGTSVIKDSKAQ